MNQDAEDNKAELALLLVLHRKSRGEQRQICKDVDIPWNEFLRLNRKWKRVLARWDTKLGKGDFENESKRDSKDD